MNDSLLLLKDISYSYGKVKALDGVNLLLNPGVYGLLGPNGAGKSTLMKLLLGFLPFQAGEGSLLGCDVRREKALLRRRVGYMPEGECLVPEMSGVEVTAYLGELSGMEGTEAMQRAHEVLYYVGFGEERYRKASTYSTGMKQKLKLAQAIVHDPPLLFLDEPTSGMDPQGRKELLELVREMAALKRMSILFSTHLLPDVEETCDRVIVLHRGRILATEELSVLRERNGDAVEIETVGPKEPLLERLAREGCRSAAMEGERVRVVLPKGLPPSRIWTLAGEADTPLRRFQPVKSTLEELFLELLEKSDGN